MVMGNVLLTLPLARVGIVRGEVRTMSLYYRNEQTGAEARLGRTGAGFYVEAWHPDFLLPLRKTYEWFQQDIAMRDFELLRTVVSAGSQRESTLVR